MTTLSEWPEKPTCHNSGREPVGNDHVMRWREPDGDRPFRTCSYCGCIHPEDLLKLFEGVEPKLGYYQTGQDKQGVTQGEYYGNNPHMAGSDWKYGYPHKFYLHGPTIKSGKWYNDHLMDQGYLPERWQTLVELLEAHAGIRFSMKEGNLMYTAPYSGYQRF